MQSSRISCLLKCNITPTHTYTKGRGRSTGTKEKNKTTMGSCFQQGDNYNKENEILVPIRS